MQLYDTTTIAAIATARGEAGVAVIRLSGEQSWDVAKQLFHSVSEKETAFEAGHFYYGYFHHPETNDLIDDGLILAFQTPHSYTGENVIELHCHGGDMITHVLLDACIAAGAVHAQAGEFTKRAFLNGKLDLTQAESVMDLIRGEHTQMLQLASNNLRNKTIAGEFDTLRQTIIALQSEIVASVDFPDEVDEPERGPHVAKLTTLHNELTTLVKISEQAKILRDGLRVAILGRPNSGKSSMFNRLLAEDRAIVSDIEGTTRDVITETLTIQGVPVTLVDTAGIRSTQDQIELLGIERTWDEGEHASGVLYVVDASQSEHIEDTSVLARLSQLDKPLLLLANKQDQANISASYNSEGVTTLNVSAKNGHGIPNVLEWLNELVIQSKPSLSHSSHAVMALNQRQRDCLKAICEHIELAKNTLANHAIPIDLTTVPLSDALYKIDELTGRNTTEEVLDDVFHQFCVGK